MDAAARAELDALRRRAFGPGAGIDDDPASLARLIELEELARPQVAAERSEPQDAAASDVTNESATAIAEARVPTDGPRPAPVTDEPTSRPRRRWKMRGTLITGILVAAAIVVVVVLAQPQGERMPAATPSPSVYELQPVFTADPDYETLLSIRRDGSFGGYIELPSETPPPPFPAAKPLRWAASLGEYYGWDVWIAGGLGGAEDEHCILLQRGDLNRARCSDAAGQRRGALRVLLAAADIPAQELPEPLAGDERIGFWWREGGSIDVVRGSFVGG